MRKRIALLLLMTQLSACSEQVRYVKLCPARLHMPETLKAQLRIVPKTEADIDYLKDLVVQQEQLPE